MVEAVLIAPAMVMGSFISGQAYSTKTARGLEKRITPFHLSNFIFYQDFCSENIKENFSRGYDEK